MPTCKLCNNHFPNRIKINNVYKVLNSRKYCLDCSPFGCRNNKQKHIENTGDTICDQCGKNYNYKDRKGHTSKLCNSCLVRNKKIARKLKMVNYKGGKCVKCGYSKNIKALQFHHLDESSKLFDLSSSYMKN